MKTGTTERIYTKDSYVTYYENEYKGTGLLHGQTDGDEANRRFLKHFVANAPVISTVIVRFSYRMWLAFLEVVQSL
jgi:hypothetical protein